MNVVPIIADNVVITSNTDGSFDIEYVMENPQDNAYAFYWRYHKAYYSSRVLATPSYRDKDSGVYFNRYVKDLSDSTLIKDQFYISEESNGAVNEIVMRNEDRIKIHLVPDNITEPVVLEVMILPNPLMFKRG